MRHRVQRAAVPRQRKPSPRSCAGRWSVIVLSCAAVLNSAAPASARDLDLLIRLLAPGFIAQDFAGMCRLNDPGFTPSLTADAPPVDAFTRHLEAEVTSGLTQAEAAEVVKVAADTARATSENVLHELATGKGANEINASIGKWCGMSGKVYIERVENDHYAKHAGFDQTVEKAKQP